MEFETRGQSSRYLPVWSLGSAARAFESRDGVRSKPGSAEAVQPRATLDGRQRSARHLTATSPGTYHTRRIHRGRRSRQGATSVVEQGPALPERALGSERLSLPFLEPLRTRHLTRKGKFRGSQVNYSGPRPLLGRRPARTRRSLQSWRLWLPARMSA